ncbi:hypothetical protein B0H15DRAFT_866313 [Mycena belliarum]|uniref:Uncharacterized protein n=1 Tax=Mycena belliarum TaxID=1033014 RepID=A0AAD6TPM1_9AGAR|nr:hypothetical protein B0H15DRAFT_866313 [Mycena belliae]
MWAKLSSAAAHLKPKQAPVESETSSHGDVMSSVFEQHPNLSVFHNPNDPHPSPPPSPSKSSRMGLFKRHTKGHDESMRAPSPMKLPVGLPKKIKSGFGAHGNASQLSVGPSSLSGPPAELSRASSHDMLSPPASQAKRRSSFNFLKRPSIDGLRSPTETTRSPSRAEEREHDPMQDPTTPLDARTGSVRSILRDRNTPGTGQNVRFFSRDAYKVLSPDQSMDTDYQSAMLTQAVATTPAPLPDESFLDRLQRSGSTDSNVSSSLPRFASSSKFSKTRPTVAEIFSPLGSPEDNSAPQGQESDKSDSRLMSQLPPLPAPDFTNFFDMSQDLEMSMPLPPGLGFDVEMSINNTETEGENGGVNVMTSTPYRVKGKGKERETDLPKENLAPTNVVDETIFHAQETAPRLPPALHDRSNSFSLGQTVFYSMAHSDSKRSSASSVFGDYPAYPSSAKSSPLSTKGSGSPSSPGIKGRNRALSDTVFMSMMRTPSPKRPEADINDESSADLVVYSSPKDAQPKPEPDPFSMHATTYYTPQTLIPATPPPRAPAPAHARKTSKEGDLIVSLQTQLALQTELCAQFETDLRARDALVEALGKKLSEVESVETKRRGLLRTWKKKVAELERACRYLEEEVEGSRQESMERSIMDEASSEALRMLHRQIAGLEREKEGAKRVEDMLRAEVTKLEGQVREKTDDVKKLHETLWRRDEYERELKVGIQEAKEQMEMMGNVSIGLIDEDELRKMAMVKDQRHEEERERHKDAQDGWEEEKEELLAAIEHAKLENAGLVAELDNYKQQLKDNEEEAGMLKSELEAQWEHTEKGADRLEAVEVAKHVVERERDALKAEVAELEQKIVGMEAEWADTENKQIDLENDIQELWDVKEALEKEREELMEQIREHEGKVETLQQDVQARDNRIIELDQERQYALDNVSRLEENIRRRDAEVADYSQRNLQREAETEELREQMSRMKREQASALEAALAAQTAEAEQQARQAKERAGDLKDEIERLRRQIHELQQESADKEVKIVQITKQRAQDKQDLQGLNIALDSKQQELELLKRRMGVRGTGGATPAQPSKIGHQRRDSTVFTTPGMTPRPPSVLSDAGTDAGTDGGSASGAKIPALGKSARLNSASVSASKPAARVPGSMGPPTSVAKRTSMVGTPTPTPRVSSLSRSTSAKPALASSTSGAPVAHRRVASATLDQSTARAVKARQTMASPAPSVEKENVELARPASSRARVPVPAA